MVKLGIFRFSLFRLGFHVRAKEVPLAHGKWYAHFEASTIVLIVSSDFLLPQQIPSLICACRNVRLVFRLLFETRILTLGDSAIALNITK